MGLVRRTMFSPSSPMTTTVFTAANITFNTFEASLAGSPHDKPVTKDVVLKTIAETLRHIHDKLRAGLRRQIITKKVPVMLYKTPRSLLQIKANIDKYIQYGLSNGKARQKMMFLAYQWISDYCVGHRFSDNMEENLMGGHGQKIARAVLAFAAKKSGLRKTVVGELLTMCEQLKGSRIVDEDFDFDAVGAFSDGDDDDDD